MLTMKWTCQERQFKWQTSHFEMAECRTRLDLALAKMGALIGRFDSFWKFVNLKKWIQYSVVNAILSVVLSQTNLAVRGLKMIFLNRKLWYIPWIQGILMEPDKNDWLIFFAYLLLHYHVNVFLTGSIALPHFSLAKL